MDYNDPIREPMPVWDVVLIALESLLYDVETDPQEYDFAGDDGDPDPTPAEIRAAIEAIKTTEVPPDGLD